MSEPNTTKRCPLCAEEILEAAVKCKHCGSMLTPQAPTTAPHVQTTSAGMLWKVFGAIICGLGVAAFAVSINPPYDNATVQGVGAGAALLGLVLFIVGRAQD